MMIAVLQARMSSTRLPGKVMKPILGRPMVALQMKRIARSRRIDRTVLATSRQASDDPLAELAAAEGWRLYRGDLDDVLARFAGAAAAHGPADHVVRLTADCPLIDSGVIDAMIDLHLATGADYTSNSMPGQRTYPDGLDAEVMTVAALERAAREAPAGAHREHVTPYLYEDRGADGRPPRFKLAALTQPRDLGLLRWTVDTAVDFAFVTAVYGELYPVNPAFGQDDVLALLERRPDIAAINAA